MAKNEIQLMIIRPSVEKSDSITLKKFIELLESGYKIIDKTACEDRIVYILEKKWNE